MRVRGRTGRRAAGVLLLLLALFLGAQAGIAQTVATYHGDAARRGNFVMPALTWQAARTLRLDRGFAPRFEGHLYAQPLYWHPPGRKAGVLIVASESNTVAAIDAADGQTLWRRVLGAPARRGAFACGNIDPLGVTGTPVIDEAAGRVYVDAMVDGKGGPRHRIFALSLADGAVVPGWPVDVDTALHAAGYAFSSHVQNQRGALALLDHRLYVPYGGFFGDCGDYRGWVVGVDLDNPRKVSAWHTRARGGGIWAPGGIASDGRALYVATGNTFGAARWSDGEAVIRLAPDLHRATSPADYFAPANWPSLDGSDLDLGGSNPLLFDLPSPAGPQKLVLALGKNEHAYVLDRSDLGGIGGSLLNEQVSTYAIRSTTAAYPVGEAVNVAFEGWSPRCPSGQPAGNLTVLRLRSGNPPALATAWCGAVRGAGGPIVTTTDGRHDPIVWVLGAEGDNRLHGYRGDTGEVLFTGPVLRGLRHFQTLIAADGRLYVGADGRLYAFSVSR